MSMLSYMPMPELMSMQRPMPGTTDDDAEQDGADEQDVDAELHADAE